MAGCLLGCQSLSEIKFHFCEQNSLGWNDKTWWHQHVWSCTYISCFHHEQSDTSPHQVIRACGQEKQLQARRLILSQFYVGTNRWQYPHETADKSTALPTALWAPKYQSRVTTELAYEREGKSQGVWDSKGGRHGILKDHLWEPIQK